jgi:hypothetical protein
LGAWIPTLKEKVEQKRSRAEQVESQLEQERAKSLRLMEQLRFPFWETLPMLGGELE